MSDTKKKAANKAQPARPKLQTPTPKKRTPVKRKPENADAIRSVASPAAPAVSPAKKYQSVLDGAIWVLVLGLTGYIALALATFDVNDPSLFFIRNIPNTGVVSNKAGLLGAYLADIGYHGLGLSVWWTVAGGFVWLFRHFRTTDKAPHNWFLFGVGLFMVLFFTPVVERLLWLGKLSYILQRDAGGWLGSMTTDVFLTYFGKSGSLFILTVFLAVGFKLLVQFSYRELAVELWKWLKKAYNDMMERNQSNGESGDTLAPSRVKIKQPWLQKISGSLKRQNKTENQSPNEKKAASESQPNAENKQNQPKNKRKRRSTGLIEQTLNKAKDAIHAKKSRKPTAEAPETQAVLENVGSEAVVDSATDFQAAVEEVAWEEGVYRLPNLNLLQINDEPTQEVPPEHWDFVGKLLLDELAALKFKAELLSYKISELIVDYKIKINKGGVAADLLASHEKFAKAVGTNFVQTELDENNQDIIHIQVPQEVYEMGMLIVEKLGEFGIKVELDRAIKGPVITRYEILPNKGVKGSQIFNLSKDLARSMAVESVRVVETIQGKNTIGIEVPNDIRKSVLLHDVLQNQTFRDNQSKLTMALGVDIVGNAAIVDLAKMPHVLVGGMTGSGKSVGVNGMIMSILFKAKPEEVRFIMIDPKMLELSVYDGIPHLLCPVVTDMKAAGHALNWCVAEMEKRYRVMMHIGVRNLASYNEKVQAAINAGEPIANPFSLTPDEPEPLEVLPQIVIVIDELADLMMTERKSVETQITRIAQKARAAGMHMIVATQRPSVDVVTGLIKANIPTRIAFTVQSKIDSRTILDLMGAEDLLKNGDMLFLLPGNATPTRLQGAFVSDDEVHQVVGFVKAQAEPNYIDGLLTGEALLDKQQFLPPDLANQLHSDKDELFNQAVDFVLTSRKTSISSLQRALRVGYNRAANLMQLLEDEGVVSPPESNGTRKILHHRD